MDPQFEELAQHLKSELATVIADQVKSELAIVVAEQFAAAESRLVGQYKIHAEEMKAEVKLAAEGHARTVESIYHTLDRLEKIVDSKFGDHDSTLDRHNERISALEKKRSTS